MKREKGWGRHQTNSKNNEILFFWDSLHIFESTNKSKHIPWNIITGYIKSLLDPAYNRGLGVLLGYQHHPGWPAVFLSLERPEPQRRELLWSVSLELKRSAKLLVRKLKKILIGW